MREHRFAMVPSTLARSYATAAWHMLRTWLLAILLAIGAKPLALLRAPPAAKKNKYKVGFFWRFFCFLITKT